MSQFGDNTNQSQQYQQYQQYQQQKQYGGFDQWKSNADQEFYSRKKQAPFGKFNESDFGNPKDFMRQYSRHYKDIFEELEKMFQEFQVLSLLFFLIFSYNFFKSMTKSMSKALELELVHFHFQK